MRPVSVGPLLYRCWAKLRFRHISWQLVQCLPSLQAGGLPGLGAETLVCALQNETSPSSHPFVASLDFCKAFDSCDWQLAVQLLQRAGIPDSVCRCLQGMWENQVRWVSFGSCVAKSPIRQIPALLQGDPFAPLAMSLIIAPIVRRIHDRHPQIFQTTYLDDRTAAFTSMNDLKGEVHRSERHEFARSERHLFTRSDRRHANKDLS